MDKLQVFNYNDKKIRTVQINDETWFVGKDVAEILGYVNLSKALIDHVYEEDKLNNESLSSLGQRGGWIINESGLYNVILRSDKPQAKSFRKWVTSEVLPSIRKKGVYLTDEKIEEMLLNPDTIIKLASELKKERKEKRELEVETSRQKQMLGELKPKIDYLNKILSNKGLITITQIAKDYGMSAIKMNKLLHEMKIQFTQGDQWLLYSKYHDKGYTHSETILVTHTDGTQNLKMNTKWTQKGRIFLYELLKREGILSMIERAVA